MASVVIVAACTSSGSGDPAAGSVTLHIGALPPDTGRLVGSHGTPGGLFTREALHATDRVLLGLPNALDTDGAGPPIVLRSTDEGRSWRPIALPGPGGTDRRVLWAGGGRAAVLALEAIRPFGGGTGIVRISNDAGATWRAITVPDPNGSGR